MRTILRNFILISLSFALSQTVLFSDSAQENRVLLVNGFDHGLNFNDLKGRQGGDQEAPGLLFPSVHYISAGTAGPTGECLRLSYDVHIPGSYTFYWMKMGEASQTNMSASAAQNLSEFNYFGFWVKGEQGKERFKIEIHQDADGDGRYIAGKDISSFVYIDQCLKNGVDKKWDKVCIPLKDFKAIADWSKILEVVFTFENFSNLHKISTIDVDDLVFGTAKNVSPSASPDPVKISKESILAEGSGLEDGKSLNPFPHFSIALEGPLKNSESLWIVVSPDGFSWKTVGKYFLKGESTAKIEWQNFFLDSKENFMLDVWAFDSSGQKTSLEKPFTGLKLNALSDDAFLEAIEKRTFEYFWKGWDSETGLFLDATTNDYASIAATGFGLSAYCLGAERGWVSKEEAKARILKTVDTFLNKTYQHSGFFYHFLKMHDATRFGNCEVSVVDTAILMWGLFTASEYFGEEVKTAVEKIYSRIVWKDFLIQNQDDPHFNQFRMGWAPEGGPDGAFLDAYWDYYSDEVILISLLAIASPDHPVDPSVFYAWKREQASYGTGRPFVQSWHGGLFAYQYAHAWIDFKGLKDKAGINWWENTVDATVANRQFCLDQMGRYKTYGPQSWGITSMAYPNVMEAQGLTQTMEDYTMNYGTLPCGTGFALHDGTVAIGGPAGSLPFLPDAILPTLRNMIAQAPQVWGEFGFRSSYNLDLDWFSTSYYGIDLGPTLMSIENDRTGFFWDLIKKNTHITQALQKAGFEPDPTVYKSPKIEDKSSTGELSSIRVEDQGLVVEDFDDTERVKSSLGVKFGAWDKDPQDDTQKASVEIDPGEKHNHFGASLRIDYDVDSPKPAFNGFWMKLNNLDASGYTALEFWVKGSEKGFPAKFKIELKEDSKIGATYASGLGTAWKKISIPLSEFRGLLDFKQLTELTIVFEDHAVGQKTGTIYLDDIRFVKEEGQK